VYRDLPSFTAGAEHFPQPRIAFQPLALLQWASARLFMALSLPLHRASAHCVDSAAGRGAGIVAVLLPPRAFSIQSWAQSVLPATHMALAVDAGAGLRLDYLVPGDGCAARGFAPRAPALMISSGASL